jgi:nicotinamide-nucleotide amidase
MPTERELTRLAQEVVNRLKSGGLKLVLAESCTAGLGSAILARIPGVSEFHCGSAVTYQVETKARWLNVPRSLLSHPGPVSRAVATKMALGALDITPQADVAAAVTGHLGPDAPRALDGVVYLAFARRQAGPRKTAAVVKKLELAREPDDKIKNPRARRLRRQRSAAAHLLAFIRDELI